MRCDQALTNKGNKMEKIKFCINCKHFEHNKKDQQFSQCLAPVHINLVTGEFKHYYATAERSYTASNSCGPEAIHFEAKV
jgi:hypothetical protein